MNKDLNEYSSFLKSTGEVPSEFEAAVRVKIIGEMNPSLPKTVSKSFLFHALGSLITLLFCPQFGISITGASGLMPYLMNIHPALCFFSCGVLWMLIGEILSAMFLSFDEQRVLGMTRWGLTFSLLLLSILGFACVGRIELDTWFGVWLSGAILVAFAFNAHAANRFRQIRILASSTLK